MTPQEAELVKEQLRLNFPGASVDVTELLDGLRVEVSKGAGRLTAEVAGPDSPVTRALGVLPPDKRGGE
jgi:hypothetical protein